MPVDSKKFPQMGNVEKGNYREIIIKSLRKGPKTPAEIREDQGLPKNVGSKMAHHFGKLLDDNIIEKKPGAIYQIIETQQKPLDQKILKVLESGDFGKQNFEQIKKLLELQGIKSSEIEILESLKNLKHRLKIWKYNELFFIPISQFNNYNRCIVCKKTLEDDQLIISEQTMDDAGGVSNYLMHATCLNKKERYVEYNLTNCDYCGLCLNASNLGIRKNSKINIDAEIDILFNEPFSKLFSVLDGKYYDSAVEDGTAGGYAHFKRKDGKQYHPYCFEIIEKKKEPKK